MPSNSHFAAALRELVEQQPVQGLFARCFAEADGDEAKTKARYIALRAVEIEEQENAIRCKTEEEARKREIERQEEAKKKKKEKQKVINSFTFETFRKEYHREIPLHYYGYWEQQDMFDQWRKEKLKELEDDHESAPASDIPNEENNPHAEQATKAFTPQTAEIEAFIQKRLYYYLPRWDKIESGLGKTVETAKGTFNWAAFFFTIFWLAYRKMYALAILIWLVLGGAFMATDYFFGDFISNIGWILVMVFFGKFGNSIFKAHVERKLKQIKSLPENYQAEAIKRSGGTNWLAVIPFIILQALTFLGGYLEIVQQQSGQMP